MASLPSRRRAPYFLTMLVAALLFEPVLADDEADAKFARAAFACAIFAAESSELSRNQSLASDLARAAWPKALSVSKIVMEQWSVDWSKNGPLGAFIAEMPPEFLASLYFAEATKEVEAVLPQAGETNESYDAFKLHRETLADLEFSKRNCALINP